MFAGWGGVPSAGPDYYVIVGGFTLLVAGWGLLCAWFNKPRGR